MHGCCAGINGCSLKTEANCQVAASVPLDKLMLETDAPWCEIRASHASRKHVKTAGSAKDKKKYEAGHLVKGRNEPCNMVQVLEAMAGLMQESDMNSLADQIFRNTTAMFWPDG